MRLYFAKYTSPKNGPCGLTWIHKPNLTDIDSLLYRVNNVIDNYLPEKYDYFSSQSCTGLICFSKTQAVIWNLLSAGTDYLGRDGNYMINCFIFNPLDAHHYSLRQIFLSEYLKDSSEGIPSTEINIVLENPSHPKEPNPFYFLSHQYQCLSIHYDNITSIHSYPDFHSSIPFFIFIHTDAEGLTKIHGTRLHPPSSSNPKTFKIGFNLPTIIPIAVITAVLSLSYNFLIHQVASTNMIHYTITADSTFSPNPDPYIYITSKESLKFGNRDPEDRTIDCYSISIVDSTRNNDIVLELDLPQKFVINKIQHLQHLNENLCKENVNLKSKIQDLENQIVFLKQNSES